MEKVALSETRPNGKATPPMSLEEARKVTWLRNRPKPLGELLDEGYLNKERLEWAAKWAYNPQLKEAARVLLESQAGRWVRAGSGGKPLGSAPAGAISAGISLEAARSTPWPFTPHKGQPMGVLSETGNLSLKDLAYAVESAWDQRVRRAAIALLVERLDQALQEPEAQAGPLNVVKARRSFAAVSQLRLSFLEGVFVGLVLALAVALFALPTHRQTPDVQRANPLPEILRSSPWKIVVASIVAAGSMGLAWFGPRMVLEKLDAQIEAYRRGEEGEERVVEKARRALDGSWVLFRNVVLPGRKRGDLDIVLLGPPGVWVLEVKTLRGNYWNVGDVWFRRVRKSWRKMRGSPSRQARNAALALKGWLKADGIKTYVHEAVVWADEEAQVTVEDPIVPVWTLSRMEDELGNLWDGQRLARDDGERIVQKLNRACRASKNGAW